MQAGSVSGDRTVLVTSRSFGSGREHPERYLTDSGFAVERGDHRHDPVTLAEVLERAAAWIAGTGPIGRAQLDHAPRLRLVVRYGVGTDAVDRSELERRGIVLANTPGANTAAVADHTVGLMLAALRSTLQGDRAVRDGLAQPPPGRELGSCTVGLVGFGAVGRAVHRRLRAFGSAVVAHDPYLDHLPSGDVQLVGLAELFERAEVVSLHAPPGPVPIVDARMLALSPAGAVLVNTARAELVDEPALAAALHEGRLAAVAVDVLSTEHGATSPLLDAPNVTVTPHLAGQTFDAIDRMGMTAANDVVRVLRDGLPPRHVVVAPRDEEAAR